MYKLLTRPDGSFQILDDAGENHGVFGDRIEALQVMGLLNARELVKSIPVKPLPKKELKELKIPYTREEFKKPQPHRTSAKSKPIVVKRSPLKAKRGRPKKAR